MRPGRGENRREVDLVIKKNEEGIREQFGEREKKRGERKDSKRECAPERWKKRSEVDEVIKKERRGNANTI